MTVEEQIRKYAVRYISKDEDYYIVVIGNCGRYMDKDRTFRAKTLETILRQIQRAFD